VNVSQRKSESEFEYYDEEDDEGQIPDSDLFEGEINDDYLNNALFSSSKGPDNGGIK